MFQIKTWYTFSPHTVRWREGGELCQEENRCSEKYLLNEQMRKKEWIRYKIITEEGKCKHKRTRKKAVGFLGRGKAHLGVLAGRSICAVVVSLQLHLAACGKVGKRI